MPLPSMLRRIIHGGSDGSALWGPLHTISRRVGDSGEVQDEIYGGHLKHRPEFLDDFLGDTLLDEVRVYDMSPAGAPTADIQADGRNGILELTLASTNEYELVFYDWGTIQNIPASQRPFFQCRLNVKTLPSTNERMVFGLASQITLSQNNNLDADVVSNCWFRIEASGALLAEADDATTDTDDADCGFTLVANTYYWLTIDMRDIGRISYQLADATGYGNREVKTIAASAFAVTDLLSPFFAVQKASGTGVPSLYLDFYRVSWDR